MTDEVPESIRRYVRENREDLEYILKHGSSLELRAYAAALLIRGLRIRRSTRSLTSSNRAVSLYSPSASTRLR